MKFLYFPAVILALALSGFSFADEISGRFAPPQGKVLVFAGQDNSSLGGTPKYRDGYVENTGIPGGISHYIPFAAGWTNEFGYQFPAGKIPGLLTENDWGSGPMHLLPYLDSPMLDRCVIHLSIAMPGGNEEKVAEGSFDHLIAGLTALVSQYQDHPFMIRIGHEFGAPGNHYDPESFRTAFRRIVDALRTDKLPNVAIVYSASTEIKAGQFEEYDPGSKYYDWIGYSWWGGENDGRYALEFARKVKKPVLISEAAPQGYDFSSDNSESIWENWFEKFFAHIETNTDVVRGVSYSNTDWDKREMWEGWGNTRIESSPEILQKWRDKMNSPMYINSVDKPFSHIGFPAPYSEPGTTEVEPYAVYKDREAPVEQRVADLLGKMTLEEKIAQLSGWWDRDERTLRREGQIFTREFYSEIAPHGIGILGSTNLNTEEDIRQHNSLLEYAKHSRLGIPPLRNSDANHGLMRIDATSFPAPIAISCSWDPELIEEVYRHTAREARSRGLFHVMSPNINLARDPRWGRIDETLGEDPFLTSRLGAAMVRGLQNSGTGVSTALKNFAGSGNARGGRNLALYAGGKRQLLDNEIEAFRYIIKETEPVAVVPAINGIDGLPGHANPWLLNDVLREKIGFSGLVLSEDHALSILHDYQKIGESLFTATATAFQTGIQVDLPDGASFQNLRELVEQEKVSVEQIDDAVSSVLSWKFRLGLFEAPRLSFTNAVELTTSDQTRELATKAALESIVLLKNDGILPLDLSTKKKIAVIGPNAAVCRLGSGSGTPRQTVSLLDGIKAKVGDRAEVLHAGGCMIALNDTHDSYLNWRHVNDVNFVSPEDNQPLIMEALEVATEADIVILALGENELLGREAWGTRHLGDCSSLELTESQRILAESILATGKPVILYLTHGRPLVLGKSGQLCNAILTGHYTGQETGTAVAEILFGDASPSGKLTVSWPRSVGHLPSHYNQSDSHLYDYIDAPASAVYPFGHGLSYTKFEYTDPVLSQDTISTNQSIDVTFEVTNTGIRAGTEIAQLYVTGESFPVLRPSLELKGFSRVFLEPGETRFVTIRINSDDLHFHDDSLARVLPSGQYKIRVGTSSRKLSAPALLRTESAAKVDMTEEPSNAPPNILFVAIDDLRPELGTYGASVSSPNIDQLAATGMRFDSTYCQQAVCGASRLSVMSGLYPTHTGEQSVHVAGWRNRHPDLLTLNHHFRNEGYETIGLGKIFHGISGSGVDPDNWDRWIEVNGPEYASLESIEALKKAVESGRVGDSKDPPKGPTTEKAEVSDDTYVDGKRAKKASEILNELSSSRSKPFFMALGFSKPHLPFVAPAKYWDLYRREDFRMPPNPTIPPGYPTSAANLNADEMQKYSDFEGDSPSDFSSAMNKRLLHGFAAAVSYVDACFGRVMKTLEDTGLAENTIVVLWGDHGWKLGDHSTWCKHTNFECDTRVPLIIRDPRLEGGQSTSRLVELIDLYPTLCDLAGITVPGHCQGRSFRHLLTDPDRGHRWDAYSSYPTWNGGTGHSIRYKQFRYTEWYDRIKNRTHRVLTDLDDDPGEVTNLVFSDDHLTTLIEVEARLKERINAALPVEKEPAPEILPAVTAVINPETDNLRQTIDGFGGSIAFWGTSADDDSLKTAINGLNVKILRAQGEVSPEGDPEHNRDVLQRAMQINPNLEILLTFWQPKSVDTQNIRYWMNEVETGDTVQYELKPEKEMEWAIEIAMRIRQYREWGINVETIGIQNEANWSHPGTQTCRWEPGRLADFIETKVQPALNAAGLRDIKIAAPDLAYIGDEGSEVDRFIPVLTSQSVNIAAYHMYDSFNESTEDKSLFPLQRKNMFLNNLRSRYFPDKRLWMTETTGAQWNSADWHTYGWTPELSDHEKAVKAARYIHTTLVDAQANAFLWWGLVYSTAPQSESDSNVITKHRDEGLVLVEEKQTDGRQRLLERTKKYYTFRQYSGFVKPGYRRIHVDSPHPFHVSAYLSPDRKVAVCIAINDTESEHSLRLDVPGSMKLIGTFQTDEVRNCSPVDFTSPLPSRSVRTSIYSISEPQ
ncbi:MAG: glycoside hydrolase family 3 N-terminal domain-containing protein [Verrucomicrobiales bacterium]|nr:glycoside hydrolase family 3 N-terminal domain-containing protein [Verrucomicrobiales bacterium]